LLATPRAPDYQKGLEMDKPRRGRERLVSVIGDGQCSPEVAALAEEVGRRLAEAGYTIVCGGLGGVMEAACRGAKRAGGRTVGILPGGSATAANRWVDIPIVTNLGEARNVLVVKSGAGAIAIGGAYGTLSEIALALRDGKPVVGLATWQLTHPGGATDPVLPATTPEQAVAILLAALPEEA
jgi:uncharacterized protein (TIGR00725 family)